MQDLAYAFWKRIDRPGRDAVMVVPAKNGWVLVGYAAFHEKGVTGLRYHVDLAPDFSTCGARIEGFRDGRLFAHDFRRDHDGWTLDGSPQAGLEDLIHLDFGFTPATNWQQLRHANLAVGQEADIPAAWFDIGEPGLARLPQHYRRLSDDRYHYASPTVGYDAVLELAPNGFARLYPDLWKMEPDP